MRMFSLHTTLIAGAFLALGLAQGGQVMAGQSGFCLTGTVSTSQSRIDCAGRWVAADGTRFGPQYDPRNTPHTPHPGFSNTEAKAQAHSHAGSIYHSTQNANTPASVWTPPAPYHPDAGPVVMTRGNQNGAFDGNYDVYVPTRPYLPPAAHTQVITAQHRACNDGGDSHQTNVYCGQEAPRLPQEGCYSLDDHGQTIPAPCPTGERQVYSSSAQAHASASASASVNISNATFFNTLSGGVGGNAPMFFGGGGSTIITGGGGSVLSRAPLIRFRSHNRGGGGGGGNHGCGCGGGMMGMGGGD
ncbi:MAG: hypothetical protein COA85_11475 [Robiginitomaculum sp.]|nr:MAG: hypothetical protein COA85_11475 [Robiginitomaculum sp.]